MVSGESSGRWGEEEYGKLKSYNYSGVVSWG